MCAPAMVIGSRHHRPRGWWALQAPLGAMLVVGAVGVVFPELFGNGKILAHLGAGLGGLWALVWPGAAVGAFSLIGAAAMIVPMALATVIATLVARHLDGYSIYCARLPAPGG